jgi:hypothetical protein
MGDSAIIDLVANCHQADANILNNAMKNKQLPSNHPIAKKVAI